MKDHFDFIVGLAVVLGLGVFIAGCFIQYWNNTDDL